MPAAPGLEKYPRVFEPLKLGPLEVRNRIYMPPHGQPFWVGVPGSADRMPAAEAAFYYRERAAGGVALIFFSTMLIPMIGGVHGSPTTRPAIESFARLAEIVHEEGAKMISEIMYGGSSVGRWEPVGPLMPALGSSLAQAYNTPTVRRALKGDEIKLIVERYASTTRNLRQAGWDGVEIHASHGVLMEHFLSTYFNRREDGYGGDVAGRCRFLVEALEAVHSEIGPGMAVGMRICADELIAGGVDAAGTREILEHLAPKGLLDFVDLDCSVEPEQAHLLATSFFEPKHHNLPHVEAVASAATGMTVLATPGRVTSMAEAEKLLADGAIDMVGIGRGHIAEPQLIENALHGHEDRSRACIAGNHCLDARAIGGLGCAINPATAREERWGVRAVVPASERRRVVVVGGGPGGCEAARVAALRGHKVTLSERRPALGGSLALWAKLPGRGHLDGLTAWYSRELERLGVDVELGVEADVESVLRAQPDVVIAATGSRFSRGGDSGFKQTPIPGSNQDFVHIPEDILEDGVALSGRVVVLDEEGRHAAAGIAAVAAEGGADVDYITRFPYAARAMLGNSTSRYLIDQMRKAGVRINTDCYISEIGDQRVTIYETATGAERVQDVDAVVLATMRAPETALADQLDGHLDYIYVIGDAASPRTLIEATYEGQRFARVIGEPDMPISVTADMFAAEASPLRAATQA